MARQSAGQERLRNSFFAPDDTFGRPEDLHEHEGDPIKLPPMTQLHWRRTVQVHSPVHSSASRIGRRGGICSYGPRFRAAATASYTCAL
jgi:hypothetical protein